MNLFKKISLVIGVVSTAATIGGRVMLGLSSGQEVAVIDGDKTKSYGVSFNNYGGIWENGVKTSD